MTAANKISQIDKYAAKALMVSFFLPMQLQPLVAFAMCFYFIYRTFRSKERPPVTNYVWALFLGAIYIMYVLAIPFTPAKYSEVLSKLCEYRLSYLLLPIVFASISPQKIHIILGELAWFVYCCFVVCVATNLAFVACLLTKSSFFLQFGMPPGGFRDVSHVTYRIFFEVFTGHHPTYISMYLVFAISVLLLKGERMNRKLKYALFYSMLIFLLPLLAKSPLVALMLIFMHTAWLRRKSLMQYKWMFAGVLLVLVLSYLFVPFVSQRVNEMGGFSNTSVTKDVTDNSIHERKMILSVDLGMLKQYWISGAGPGKLMYLLKIRYFFYSIYYGRNISSFDPHNEYLYQWLSFGLIGIILFAGALLTHLFTSIRKRNHLYLYFLMIVMITFFTESVLTVQHGIIFYSFFASLFFFYNNKLNVTEPKEN